MCLQTPEQDIHLIKVFNGPEVSATLLKSRLDEIGVDSIIKNDANDAFWGVTPQVIDLYIDESDLEKAEDVLKEFV